MWQDSAQVGADIFTQHHRYSGQVNTRGSRLADFLNDKGTEAVEMREVRVSQPTNAVSGAVECSQLLLKKDSIVLAIPTGSYEAPARRIYSYVEKQHYLAHIMVPGYNLVGTAHLPYRANTWLLMSEGTTTPSFIPITDVTVRFATGNAEPLQTKVVIFHRQLIESIYLAEKSDTEQSLLEAAADLRAMDALELVQELSEVTRPEAEQNETDGLHLRKLDIPDKSPARA